MDKYLFKSNPFDAAKGKKRTFGDFNEDNESTVESLNVKSSKKKKRLNDTEMKVCNESDNEIETVDTNSSSPEQSVTTLKAKLRKTETQLLRLDAENKRLKEENKKLKSKAFTARLTPAKSAGKKEKSAAEISRMKKKYLKKWATRLPKLAAMKKTKFTGYSKEIVLEDVGFEKDDFEAIFGGKGYLVQPRPDNKPKSTVIIRDFSSWSEIEPLFKGDGFALQETLTVSIWRNRNFSKARYWGDGEAKIASLSVCYNKSRKVLSLKFQCEREGGESFGGWFF